MVYAAALYWCGVQDFNELSQGQAALIMICSLRDPYLLGIPYLAWVL